MIAVNFALSNTLRLRRIASRLLFLSAAFISAPGGAAEIESLLARYPGGSIQSVETAERALAEARQERAAVDARFALDERNCHPKFFATACLEDAKEQRRVALTHIRSVEVEANGFRRRARVVERDQALAERRAQEEAEEPQRKKEQLEKEASAAQKAAATTEVNAQRAVADTRAARQEAKLKQRQAEQTANAKKRAENVAAYEKKQREAQAHQREIAAKKVEKERGTAK